MSAMMDARLKDNDALSTQQDKLCIRLKSKKHGQQFEGSYSCLLFNSCEDIPATLSPVLLTPPGQDGRRETWEGQVDDYPEGEQPRAHDL